MADQGKTSPWVWVGCGCLLAILLIVGAIAAAVFWVGRTVNEFADTMKDPEARAARVEEILGTDELPEGYNPVVGFNIPFVGEVVVLAAKVPDEEGRMEELGDRGFAYLKLSGMYGRRKRDEIKAYIDGKGKSPNIQIQNGIRVDAADILERGEIEVEGGNLSYAVHRGRLEGDHDFEDGLATMMLLDCPDGPSGFGVWYAPDPAHGEDLEDVDRAGSPADPEAIRAFLAHFDLCPNP